MQNAPHRGAFSFWFFSGLKSLFDCTLRRHLTDPAWPAGLRGECPPAPAYGGCLLLYFAPKGIPTRAQSVCRRSALFHQGGEASQAGARSVLHELVPVDLVLRQQLAQLRGRGALHRLLATARQRRLAQGVRSEEHTSELQS